jgi:hypothetical protein
VTGLGGTLGPATVLAFTNAESTMAIRRTIPKSAIMIFGNPNTTMNAVAMAN